MSDATLMPPSDGRAPRFPVSVKAVVALEGRVALLKNERDEWELPGGKLEPGEQPCDTVIREISEELGVDTNNPEILDSWVYEIGQPPHQVEVLIVTHTVQSTARCDDCVVSHEHKELRFFAFSELEGLNLPSGYLNSITLARSLGRVRL